MGCGLNKPSLPVCVVRHGPFRLLEIVGHMYIVSALGPITRNANDPHRGAALTDDGAADSRADVQIGSPSSFTLHRARLMTGRGAWVSQARRGVDARQRGRQPRGRQDHPRCRSSVSASNALRLLPQRPTGSAPGYSLAAHPFSF
eukprot:1091572-Pleurochrysis_carterae.AAC.1